jgi:hypothetical protein
VQKTIFEPKRKKVKRRLDKRACEQRDNLYSSPDIMMMTKSSSLRWAVYVVHMRDEKVRTLGGKRLLGRHRSK